MNKILNILFLVFCVAFLMTSCIANSHDTHVSELKQDTIKRPPSVSKFASLMNFGDVDNPNYLWCEYIGNFKLNKQEYSHIYGYRYVDERGVIYDTLYYESKDRSIIKDLDTFKVLQYPGNGTIKVLCTPSYILHNVLEDNEFRRKYKGIIFDQIPSASIQEGVLKSDYPIEFNIELVSMGFYSVILGDKYEYKTYKYKLVSKNSIVNFKLSYLDRETNKIYLLDKDAYLEMKKE